MIAITILDYQIRFEENGMIWIEHPNGEGMLLSKQQLKDLIDKCWKDSF